MSRIRAVLAGIALLQPLVAPAIAAQQPPAEVPQPAKQGLYDKSLEAAQQTLFHYGVYDNPAELERVTEIGFRLAQETGFNDFPFTFHLIDMVVPNAFAMPGGHMFITRGMLDLDLTDDMLAALLGHEIAHVVKQHGSKMKKRAMLLNTFGQALLVGAIVGAANSGNNSNNNVYSPYDPRYGGNRSADMIQATAATTTAVSELLLRKYSRGFEDESDEEGQRWAAAAGFDPQGTRDLMELMAARMPESGGYGYWRTHPFMEDRATIGEARAETLKVQPPSDADIYRARTQKKLIAYSERTDLDPASRDLLQLEALWTWPKGPVAEQLRLEQLHEQKEAVLFEKPLDQDLGALIAAYRDQQEEVLRLTPTSSLPQLLDDEILEIVELQEKNYTRASEVFAGGVYQTRFLELFLSNYPEAPERPAAALNLGNAYSRLGRQTAAVGAYLESWRSAPDDPSGQRARAGLKVLAPNLDQLGALQELEMQGDDLELQEMAKERLIDLASSYDDPANGAEYLKRFPDGRVSERVATRLDSLADSLYAEMVLYKSVGDHVKALQKARQILTQAPMSPAADRLRDSVIAES